MGLGDLIQYYNDIFDFYGDSRVADRPLMGGPLATIAICVSYVYVSTYLGPKLMENRSPFKLKKVILVYNILQVLWSSYAVYQGLRVGLHTTVSFSCFPVDYDDSDRANTAAQMTYFYYISRLVEMFDTMFFILRKKSNQVTGLHVFHHTIMPINTWIASKFLPGGQACYWALWNCAVHVVMYSYYLLAGLGPQVQKYLWWKKYLTTFQLVQFVAIWLNSTQVLLNGCNYSKPFSAFISVQGVIFFYLFSRFYQKAYGKNK